MEEGGSIALAHIGLGDDGGADADAGDDAGDEDSLLRADDHGHAAWPAGGGGDALLGDQEMFAWYM